MIPAEFDYAVAGSLDEAIQMLVDGGEDAKLLAGGHSLIPLMKLRLAAPTPITDLRHVPGLGGVSGEHGTRPVGRLAAFFSVLIGLPAFRLRGPYFTIATIGVGEVVRVVASSVSFTGGSSGLRMPPGSFDFTLTR